MARCLSQSCVTGQGEALVFMEKLRSFNVGLSNPEQGGIGEDQAQQQQNEAELLSQLSYSRNLWRG